MSKIFNWIKKLATAAEKRQPMGVTSTISVVPSIPSEDKTNLSDMFDSQMIKWEKEFSLFKRVAKMKGCSGDWLRGNGKCHAEFKITPLHAFNNHTSSGDYYIVDATYAIDNTDMYKGRYWSKHGGVRCRICGWTLKNCDITTKLVTPSGEKVEFAQFPKPDTQIDCQTYSDGWSWNIGGNITGGVSKDGGQGSLQVNGAYSENHSKSYTVSDLGMTNKTKYGQDGKVHYELVNNRMVQFKWSEYRGMAEPSNFARNILSFHSSWIWYVPDIKDDNTDRLRLEVEMNPTYEACHFYSTEADFKRDSYAIGSLNSGEIKVENPDRTSKAIISIKNSTPNYIKNILIQSTETVKVKTDDDKEVKKPKHSLLITNTYSSGSTINISAPLGEYTIEFIAGKTKENSKSYQYKNNGSNVLTLSEVTTYNLGSGYDFEEKIT